MRIQIERSLLKNNSIVQIHGHKHSFVQIISAALILNQECLITNVPTVDDVYVFEKIIIKLGGIVRFDNHNFYFNPHKIKNNALDIDLCKKIHGSFYLIFAMAIRFGQLNLCHTGGCQIGGMDNKCGRPDKHARTILKKFGKLNHVGGDKYTFVPKNSDAMLNMIEFSDDANNLSGELISSATKLSILASLGNKFKTIILNPYFRTDVHDLLNFINECGYKTSKSNKQISIIAGQECPKFIEYQLSDCQSEIFTYITLALIHKLKMALVVNDVDFVHKILKFELKKLQEMGAKISFSKNNIIIHKQTKRLNAKNITINHKTIQSDHHPFFTILLLHSDGKSSLTENVWKNRFGYIKELNKLSTNITRKDNKIYITPLQQNNVYNDICLDGTDTDIIFNTQIELTSAIKSVLVWNKLNTPIVAYCHYPALWANNPNDRIPELDESLNQSNLGNAILFDILSALHTSDAFVIQSEFAKSLIEKAARFHNVFPKNPINVIAPPADPMFFGENLYLSDKNKSGFIYNHRLYKTYGTSEFIDMYERIYKKFGTVCVVSDPMINRSYDRHKLNSTPKEFRDFMQTNLAFKVSDKNTTRTGYKSILTNSIACFAPLRRACVWSMASMDCMGLGIPVVTPNYASFPEFVPECLRYDNEKELFNIVERLINDKEFTISASSECFSMAQEFSAAITMKKFHKLFVGLLGQTDE